MRNRSIMWDYISEEPKVLEGLMDAEEIRIFAGGAGKDFEAVYFVAHGSSYNAALAVSDFLSRNGGVRVYIYTPTNFQYNAYALQREDKSKVLVAGISQTGTSSGVVGAIREASEKGFCTLGITDTKDSPIAKEADHVLLLCCGREDSNAKTKGYSATLMVLLLLTVYLGREKGILTGEKKEAVIKELREQVEEIPAVAKGIRKWCQRKEFGNDLKELYVLGYGMNFGTAMEGQLKLMETMCIPTMFNDIGEFSHGMHRAITGKSSILLLKSKLSAKELTEETFRYLKTITRHVWMLDASGQPSGEENRIVITAYPLTQSLLLTTLAIQVLSVFAPEKIGNDPNRDANDNFTEAVHTRLQ